MNPDRAISKRSQRMQTNGDIHLAFPNVTDIVATTIENRSRKLADNV
jgi:hypothetical protein